MRLARVTSFSVKRIVENCNEEFPRLGWGVAGLRACKREESGTAVPGGGFVVGAKFHDGKLQYVHVPESAGFGMGSAV